ncbi:MAG: hypothetical protein GY909_06275 [Oligoflexia bacterium]|nr:hypothetical protein [Oligoflexia bacterium]
MKACYQTLFFALFFLFSATGFASDAEDLTPNGEFLSKDGFEEKLDERSSFQEDEDDQLEKLAEIPKVKAQIDACKALKESGTPIGKIEDCVWNGVTGSSITALDQTTKDEIYAKLKVGDDQGADKENASQYEGVGLSNINQKRSKSLKALEKFYGNMFKEAIGEDTTDGKGGDDSSKNTFVNVDQKKFHDIQQSHISKTIIDSISQFCVDAESIQEGNNIRVSISADPGVRKNQRDANINLLATPNGGPGQNQHWTRCTAALQRVCKNPTDYYSVLTNKPDQADQTETQNRACITVTYLKGKRQELVRVEEIQEQWKTHFNKNKQLGRYEIKNFKYAKKVDTENIVNVTSGQIANSEELKEAKKEEIALLEKCKQDYQGNKEACDEYLVGQEDSEKLEEEFAIRNKAATEKLKDTVKDKESLEKYLKEQNYTEEQIAKMTKDDQTIQRSIANITQSYDNQRKALVEKMRKKLANSTRTKNQQGQEVPGNFTELKKELEQNHDDWVQVTHFSNVVSGYLTFKDPNGGQSGGANNGTPPGQNTRALTRELGNSAYASDRGPASGTVNQDYFDNLQNNNKVEETESNDDGTTKNTLIDSDTLNKSILNESGEDLN